MMIQSRRSRTPASGQSGAPTIADVARLAGISPMSVSRVINGSEKVRPATREAVKAAIATLGYVPNSAARSLAGAVPLRIGLLYSNPSESYLSAFLLGGLDQVGRTDMQLVVEKCDVGDHEIEVAKRLIDSGIDGFILPPPLCDSAPLLDLLIAANATVVAVATARPRPEMAAVFIDDRAAARAMTGHLIGLGHTRIGFITGNANLSTSAERLEGYRLALTDAGIGHDEALVGEGLFTYRSGLDAAERLLSLERVPSAIFASNDDMAAATVAVAHARGLDVPSDLTVCGFDDSAVATMIWPELTTIHQPIADMSRAAVKLLAELLRARHRGSATPQRMKLDYTLIRRQSDASPRRRPRAQ